MKQEEIESVIQDLFDGQLEEEKLALLENELRTNGQARNIYRDYVQLHNALEQKSWDLMLPPKGVIPVHRLIKRQKARIMKVAVFSAAAVLLVGLVIMAFFLVKPKEPSLVFQAAAGSTFTLTHENGDEMKETVLKVGSRLQLEQGTVELNFASGVKAVLSAPADMTLHDEDKLFLNEGVAWFHVPTEAIGFQVETPELKVIDLGTEFGVCAIQDDFDEVHVFTGKVEIKSKRLRKEELILHAGQARQIDLVGRFKELELQGDLFQTKLPKGLAYLHWSFDKIEQGGFAATGEDRMLGKAVARTRGTHMSELVIEGAFGKAIAFHGRDGDGLVTAHPGFDPSTPMTVSYWVKYPSSIDQRILHCLAWAQPQSDSRMSRWYLGVEQLASEDWKGWNHAVGCSGWLKGKPTPNDGEWHHITTVFTGKILDKHEPEFLIYFDGELHPIAAGGPDPDYSWTDYSGSFVANTITMGLGQRMKNAWPVGYGAIDEVYIIQGALNQKQIQTLMETNQLIFDR